jgi:hypothetical protein
MVSDDREVGEPEHIIFISAPEAWVVVFLQSNFRDILSVTRFSYVLGLKRQEWLAVVEG